MTDISLIPTLKSEGWKVMTRSKLKSMKKEELIETIEMLENNWGATIERANNSYSYGKSEIERLEKENEKLKGYKNIVDTIKAEGFETFCEVKMFLQEHKKLEEENEELKAVCDYNCSDHKLATHNACLLCPAIRNSPHHDLKNVSDEELEIIIKNAEIEMEM